MPPKPNRRARQIEPSRTTHQTNSSENHQHFITTTTSLESADKRMEAEDSSQTILEIVRTSTAHSKVVKVTNYSYSIDTQKPLKPFQTVLAAFLKISKLRLLVHRIYVLLHAFTFRWTILIQIQDLLPLKNHVPCVTYSHQTMLGKPIYLSLL